LRSVVPSSSADDSTAAALQRYAKHLEKLQKLYPNRGLKQDNGEEDLPDVLGEERDTIYQEYIVLPAHELKKILMNRNLPINGRKPDLARRLTRDDMYRKYGIDDTSNGKKILSHAVPLNDVEDEEESVTARKRKHVKVTHFAGIRLSDSTSRALTNAGFTKPTPIQKVAIPHIFSAQNKKISTSSCILHASTGSGKTLAYLIPILETFQYRQQNGNVRDQDDNQVALILTPTRELAAQVAGIAETMAPPGMVRLILRPTNLMKRNSDDDANMDQSADGIGRRSPPKIYVGSAKSMYVSLYGDGNLPAPPTSKPEAMFLLQHTQFIVLDEVDRLLQINSASQSKTRRHEKPAAILTAAVMRLTLGKACIVAASATVGRPLKRELSRVTGLSPQECPPVLRAKDEEDVQTEKETSNVTTMRAVTIPESVRHFVVPIVERGSSPGKVLTCAYQVIQNLNPGKRILLVLTRNFGISVTNAIGALRHFGAKHAMDLVQALEDEVDGAAQYIAKHRKITGALGVGEPSKNRDTDEEGYLLVTGEDSVRGLHLDRLDVVIIAGRTKGPDEYTHVAGRTGRAGESGICINVVDAADADKLVSWEKMLGIQFQRVPNLQAVRNIS
jgi:superfamily II DNA/RNA helicase